MESLAVSIHVTTIFVLVPLILYTDYLGTLWVRGIRETLPARTLTLLHRLVLMGLAVMLVTGGILFRDLSAYLLTVPAFYIKMSFVAALIINSFFIGTLMHVAAERSFASLPKRERLPLYISGLVSGVSWVGAITAATQLGL